MEQKSMTALVSAFSRAYHAEMHAVKIFDDSVARRLFTDEEYGGISRHMADGIGYFNPQLVGTRAEALQWVVDTQLSPAPLGRAAFAERSLETAVRLGAAQYLIFAAGYDTFAYRQPDWARQLQIFEIDHPATAADKRNRLRRAGLTATTNVHYIATDFAAERWQTALTECGAFAAEKVSFCSMLGMTYYLSAQVFEDMLAVLGALLPENSAIVFDYPDEKNYTACAGARAKKQAMLASGAKEKMLASYSYAAMETMLSAHGFQIFEHLTPQEMTDQYFAAHNAADPRHAMTAFDNVNYCLAVRK